MKRVNHVLLGLCLIAPAAGMAGTPASDAPDLELLEFLGEWGDEGEAWMKQQKVEQEKAVAAPKGEVKKDE